MSPPPQTYGMYATMGTPGYNPYNQVNYQQNSFGQNYVPMQMQGPMGCASQNRSVNEFVSQIRIYLKNTHSNVEMLFNFARRDRTDIDRAQFGWFINVINLPVVFSEADLDLIFLELDMDKDGRIS